MAQPTVLSGTKLLVLIENDASPAVFAAPCGLNTRSFDIKAGTSTTIIPDCANPDAAAWEATEVTSLSAEVSGSGVMATESYAVWRDWALAGINKMVHIEIDPIGYYTGPFKVTDFKTTGTRGEKITIDLTLKSDGAVTWTNGLVGV